MADEKHCSKKSTVKPKPVVLCGPSGCGKSTIIKRLMSAHPDVFSFSVSHTTRKQREGEKNGIDYHFVTTEEMEKGIKHGDFVEHAKYSGNSYGTSKKAIMDVIDNGKICLLDIDSQGVTQMKKSGIEATYVFIKPPNFQALEQRLRKRATETEDRIFQRMAVAHLEMQFANEPGVFNVIIENDDLETACRELEKFLEEDMKQVKSANG